MKDIGNNIGKSAPDGTYTTSGAAYVVNRSPDTLRRWRRQGLCVPSQKMQAGQVSVFLYTAEDIEKLRLIARSQKPGRKREVE